jgi:hypothetical protein
MSSPLLPRRNADGTPPDEAGARHDLHPYRDDRESLIAENASLRRELARLRRRRAWPALASLATYLLILTELRDWLNGTDPVRYWLAILSLVIALGASATGAIHLIVGSRG